MEISVDALVKIDLKDEIIIFQTDTVYGVGCLLGSSEGVKRIYALKKREETKPLAVLCGSVEDVEKLVRNYSDGARLALKYWPGALTLVFKKSAEVPDFVTKNLDSVGVRIPNEPVALKILKHFGPMAVTSLNISSQPAIIKYHQALSFVNQVDYLVKGEDLSSINSTVYDVQNKKVLRQGNVVIQSTLINIGK